MRKLFYLMLVVFAIAGCSGKNRVLTLYEYNTYAKSSTMNKSVYIADIRDERARPDIVATVKDRAGSVDEYVILNQSLTSWFRDALVKELAANGISVDNYAEDIVVNIAIKEFSGNLQGYAKDNMQARASVTLEILEGRKTTTKQVSQNQSEFAVIHNGTAFEPFMQNLLKDVVAKTAREISNAI
ncbi:MAG: hypothetical protein GX282_06815 [Campylobacteraceae bacterium]|nr:hypothetical protein [Campylobacteraceae bacterium]